jgi:hypothetical protein
VRVSLQGTFDTLSVTELFGLLSTANKTGALRLEAGEPDAGTLKATVFVAGGLCCAVESDDVSRRPESEAELAGQLVDVGFSVARQPSGSFRFKDAEEPPFPSTVSAALEPAVLEITSLLDQWREIEGTIPSLDARVRLAPVLRGEQIVVSAEEWKLLIALTEMPTVREVVAEQHSTMMTVCRALKDLVDRGAVEVGVDLARRIPPASAPLVRPVLVSSAGTQTDEPTGDTGVFAEAAAADLVAAAEAEEAAADLVGRMARTRPATPDAFAEPDESPTERAVMVTEDEEMAQVAAREFAGQSNDGEAAPDRGALLRLFSALKE